MPAKTLVALAVGLFGPVGAARCPGAVAFADGLDGRLRVMTQNLYDRTDRTGLLQATTLAEFLQAVDFAYNNVVATKPNERLATIAREIVANGAGIVGLQEAAIWRTGPSSLTGPPVPAENVQFDYLQILLDDLRSLGQPYVTVAVLPGLDAQLPSTLGFDVRLTDRDALIVRSDIALWGSQIGNLQEQDYQAQASYPVAALGGAQFTERSGWVSIDLAFGKTAVRVVETHLNFDPTFNPAIANAQAAELLATAGNTSLPTILMGDFNSDANNTDATFLTYQTLLGGGFQDAWTLTHGGTIGLTCCQDENLANAASKLTFRYDLVLVRGVSAFAEKIVGVTAAEKTPSGLWPSDHGGVVATLGLQGR
jgi:hypothetical protein